MNIDQALGVAVEHHNAQRLLEAEKIYRQVLAVDPRNVNALHLLGLIAYRMGHFNDAVTLIANAIAIDPSKAEFYLGYGNALAGAGLLEDAVASLRRGIELLPQFPRAYFALGNALGGLGRYPEAIEAFGAAARLDPQYAAAYNNLGGVLAATGDLDGAIAAFRRAVEIEPRNAPLLVNLGSSLQIAGDLAGADHAYERAIAANPGELSSYNNLAMLRKDQGRVADAIMMLRRALVIEPTHRASFDNLLYTLLFDASATPQEVFAETRRWSSVFEAPLAPHRAPHGNDRAADRRLRIGYVSGDFREHPVGRSLLGLFENHDHGQFEIFCYNDSAVQDELSGRLRRAADVWRDTRPLSDERLADQVRSDRIDVLVDLTLHMAGNRLGCFALKPAPVQMTYGGYPASTGLSSIAYRITDRFLDPPGETESLNSEKLAYLADSFWCYAGDPEVEISPPPSAWAGHITFASLNNPCKASPPAIALWSRVLNEIEGARMMVMVHERDGASAYFIEQFAANGIGPERLIAKNWRSRIEYMKLYHEIDISLDPIPYDGHMTGCDSLWMGVPVITLRGDRSVGRGATSLLSNLGLGEMIARDADEYVEVASTLARDTERLAALRSSLRGRMERSPLCNGVKFAREFERIYREAWRSYVASGSGAGGAGGAGS